ncbi:MULTISPECIES: hypothetical protein [Pectobacterium]|uniref:hypothetical protein n=1 Tax=Pectobacterium TaxID=122277 RepID=UPI00051A83CF|nr:MULTISPECIES: hypothetical protein [Pectobacterium]AOR59610.1 hypothetical protein A8F97_11945 [Pectobacterium parmentieri]KHT23693.1 hypothetical protein RC95_04890 [Pectobacterium brasiliense]MCA6974199.1 hypothetical protein [Pectobacterium carotovorum]QQK71502.1 hypothetical protein HG702_08140 [Pectobacterium versatile]
MKHIHSLLLAGALLLPLSVQAVPNLWSTDSGQGVTEYRIANTEGSVFTVNCTGNPDEDHTLQHSVAVSPVGGKGADSHFSTEVSIVVVIDDQQYGIPSSLGWRNADNAWFAFIEAIGSTTQFDVYLNDRHVGAWEPKQKNVQKVLADIASCVTTRRE